MILDLILVIPALFLFPLKRSDVLAGKDRKSRIRCPVCRWEPTRGDRWYCSPGCGHAWNTFETHALCPGCTKQWRYTVCLSCGVASPHDAWYEEEEPRD